MCEVARPLRRSTPVFDILRFALLALLGAALAAPTHAAPSLDRGLDSREALRLAAPDLDASVLDTALAARAWARARGEGGESPIFSVIDYSLPSTLPRLWVFDVDRGKLLFRELVAHGEGSGANFATAFSNDDGSHQSSLGIFRTADTYVGKNGYSMRLVGLEKGVNDNALARTIVMHGAWYVSEAQADRWGRIGRSWGCPAVRAEVAKPLIDTVRDGSLLFAYFPQQAWMKSASYLGRAAADGGVSGLRTAAQ